MNSNDIYYQKYLKYKKKYTELKNSTEAKNSNLEEFDTNSYLEKLFEKHQEGFNAYNRDLNVNEGEHVNQTYGIVLNDCLDKLITDLGIGENDVIYDLGSGIGNVCFKLSLTTKAKSIGYEIVKSRHDIGVKINEEFSKLEGMNGKVTLLNENFSKLQNTTNDATIIFADSIMFPKETLELVENIALNSPNIKYIVSMKSMHEMDSFEFVEQKSCSASWATSQYNIYKKK